MRNIKINLKWDPNSEPQRSPWGNDSNRDNYSDQKNPNNNNTKG